MNAIDKESLPYRPCVGVVVMNADGLVFAGERHDRPGAWQMPQGGVDKGEDEDVAALRELREETGIMSEQVEVIAKTAGHVMYDLPDELIGKMWKGKYRGQEQRWYLLRYSGPDEGIDITQDPAEFARWQWMTPAALIEAIVPFKRDVYRQVLGEFAAKIQPA